ncbi:aldehyde dehydrogenase, partial [Blyttiomyces helicus]
AREAYASGRTRTIQWRKNQLKAAVKMVSENSAKLAEALNKDLGKPYSEAMGGEIVISEADALETLNSIDEWVKPEKVDGGLAFALDTVEVRRDPLGVVLIIGAWNYPVSLVLQPLFAAIAAGNAVIVKPSEVSPHTAVVLTELTRKYLDPTAIQFVNGAIPETTALLELRFDHILYTGNGAVAKIIMAAASKHLTPVVLELGGKNPVFVDGTVDFDITAKRIAWGKTYNCGQTCIAPDYILCDRKSVAPLAAALKRAIVSFYGEDPRNTPMAHVVNHRQFDRLVAVFNRQKEVPGTQVAVGGDFDRNALYFSHTVLTGVGLDPAENPIMEDEIFGPILPIIAIDSIDEGIAYVRRR